MFAFACMATEPWIIAPYSSPARKIPIAEFLPTSATAIAS